MRPGLEGEKPIIKHIVMGEDIQKGEVRQLFVEGGWWKSSEIPLEDMPSSNESVDSETRGALISEVVVPGKLQF